ncbi:MAG: hypothetical protein R3F20_10070 [Planctomycetota bacterium]
MLPDLPLDRFARKQLLSFRRVVDVPFEIAIEGDRIDLRPRPAAGDPLGFSLGRRRGAFVRRSGRLYGVDDEGSALRIRPEPLARAWEEILGGAPSRGGEIPLLQDLMVRAAPVDRDLLVVLYEGLRPRHRDESYLDRREILQLLVVPLGG